MHEQFYKSSFSDKGQLYCDFRYAPFSRENRKSVGENEEKLIASNIKTALESTVCLHEFPNYQIDIFILVLEDDGSVLSSSIIAAGLALVDASIPCYDVLTSSSVAIVNGQLLIDPTAEEEAIESEASKAADNHGTITISSLSAMDQVAQILFSGFIDAKLIKQAKQHILELNRTHVNYLKKVISLKICRENNES
jgi:exosome complex component MTR3